MDFILDFLGQYAGEVIAACALGLTIYHAMIARRHNILSVRPHLTQFTHREKRPGRGVLAFRLMNNGVGPAFIKSFQLLLDGKPVSDVDQALVTVLPGRQYSHTVTMLGNDYAMPAGEVCDLLVLVLPLASGETLEPIEEQLNRFDLVVEYVCAYEKPRTLDTREEGSNKAPKPMQQSRAA